MTRSRRRMCCLSSLFFCKRGQTEILGLLIIVILFSLGLLFAIKFVITKEPSTVRQSFEQVQLSSNTLNAFLKTNSRDCAGSPSMEELFRDCVGNFQRVDCDLDGDTDSDIEVNGVPYPDSCLDIHTAITEVLDETFSKWKTKYFFRAYVRTENPIVWPDGNGGYVESLSCCECSARSEGVPSSFPLPTDAGDLKVELKVCG